MTDRDTEIREAIAAGMLPFAACMECNRPALLRIHGAKWICQDCIPTKPHHLEDDGRVIRSTRGLT